MKPNFQKLWICLSSKRFQRFQKPRLISCSFQTEIFWDSAKLNTKTFWWSQHRDLFGGGRGTGSMHLHMYCLLRAPLVLSLSLGMVNSPFPAPFASGLCLLLARSHLETPANDGELSTTISANGGGGGGGQSSSHLESNPTFSPQISDPYPPTNLHPLSDF